MFGVVHADARCFLNFLGTDAPAVIGDPQLLIRCQVDPVLSLGDLKLSAESSRTGERSIPFIVAILRHRNAAADEHGRGEFFPLRHDVEAVVHPVNKVDIRGAGDTVERLGALRSPPRRMAGEIIFAAIGFSLGDATHEEVPSDLPDDQLSEKIFRNGERGARKE